MCVYISLYTYTLETLGYVNQESCAKSFLVTLGNSKNWEHVKCPSIIEWTLWYFL